MKSQKPITAFIFLALLASMSFAFITGPKINAVKDTGSASLEKINVKILINCESKEITVNAKGASSNTPVVGGEIFLFYTDYGYNLLSTATTDKNGSGKVSAIGKLDFLKNIFVLRIDDEAFQSRQVEFTFAKCFEAPPVQEKENQTDTQEVIIPQAINSTVIQPPLQVNESVQETNNTGIADKQISTNPIPCLSGFVLLILCFSGSVREIR